MARTDLNNQMIEEEINARMALRRERLNKVIHDKGLTLEELGRLTGVAKSSIQRYLTGETTKIPVDFFEKLESVTGIDKRYLACFDDKKNAPGESTKSDVEMIAIKATEKQWTYILNKLSQENRDKLQEQAELLLLKQQVQADKEEK